MRERLPDRRRSLTHTFRVGNPSTTVHWGIGFYSDGRVGEVFIDMHKFGATLRDWAAKTAMLFSALLQNQVPLSEACALITGTPTQPFGLVRGSSCVEQCTSILDAIAQELLCVYANSAKNLSMLAEYASHTGTKASEDLASNEPIPVENWEL